MESKNEFDVPGAPPWLQGLGLGLLFCIALFGDAIAMWLS
jgi:hypothetical protein